MNNDKYDNRANSSIRDLTSSEWIEQPPLNYIVADGADRIVTAFLQEKGTDNHTRWVCPDIDRRTAMSICSVCVRVKTEDINNPLPHVCQAMAMSIDSETIYNRLYDTGMYS